MPDGSLDPSELPRLVDPVRSGAYDLAVCRRVATQRAAWPLHSRVANRALARRVSRRAGIRIRDIGPMRVARREPLLALGLRDRRSGYPLETVLSAIDAGWRLLEVPVGYAPRVGRSKVTGTWRGTAQAVTDMRRALRAVNGP